MTNRVMPSKTRTRAPKSSKENIGFEKTTKLKASGKITKSARKPLGDKTNSASDDNLSVITDKPVVSVPIGPVNVCGEYVVRPRRARRLPSRYKENNILNNLSNSLNLSSSKQESTSFKTPSPRHKKTQNNKAAATDDSCSKPSVLAKKITSPVKNIKSMRHKGPIKDGCITINRPKRICRLPSKFEDHSISPKKYIPLQPINASTPLAEKPKKIINNTKSNISAIQNLTPVKESNLTNIDKELKSTKSRKDNHDGGKSGINSSLVLPKKRITKQRTKKVAQKLVSDTNNFAINAKVQESLSKSPSTPGKIFKTKGTEKLSNKNTSIKLLDGKNKLKRDSSKLDPYEFTFDPNEEPPPQKKKKKPAQQKRKPKSVTVKSNYDKNLAKALAALKNTVNTKSTVVEAVRENPKVRINYEENLVISDEKHLYNRNITTTTVNKIIGNSHLNKEKHGQSTAINKNYNVDTKNVSILVNENHSNSDETQSNDKKKNYNSVRVEDIARDFLIEDNLTIDYSPVSSRAVTPANDMHCNTNDVQVPNNADPLNLKDDLSFFDQIPIASSSMNISVRHPQASPWRAEFGSLPIKWQVNTYVKPNMTPAFESSFINFNDSKKKHVYTNMALENDDPLPQTENTSNFKQTSIISFIKEVVDKKANKKSKSSTVKANSLFEDLTSTSFVKKTNKQMTNTVQTPVSDREGNSNSITNEKRQSENINKENCAEKIKTKKDKNNSYFGFDSVDTEDQENVSPIKNINTRVKSLRSCTRGILQEVNKPKGPTRANIPITAKSKPTQLIVNTLEMKTATEPPLFPEVAADGNLKTNVQETCVSENLENDESVHLFEDIDMLFIHHPKPSRKSYGKAKNVTFIRNPGASSDSSKSDTEGNDRDDSMLSDNEPLDDLSFKLPSERPKKPKKKRPKRLLSKKEEKEVEAWAAGFNSMCEDIDEFDLVVE